MMRAFALTLIVCAAVAAASGARATSKDTAFLSDAERLQMEIDPLSGPEIEALLNKAYNAPKDVVSAAAQLVP